MVALLAVLLAIAVLAGVGYGASSRRRRIAAEAVVDIAQILEATNDASGSSAQESPKNPLTDSLTSLGTRQLLERDLAVYEGQVARYGLHVCVALIDVDDFGSFNARYGRERGNEILVAIAEQLSIRSRSGDSVYRIGGDEFICLLPEQTIETGSSAVNRMKRSVEELAIPFEGSPLGVVTVSAGLALLEADHLVAWEDLLKEAEAALLKSR